MADQRGGTKELNNLVFYGRNCGRLGDICVMNSGEAGNVDGDMSLRVDKPAECADG